MSRRIRAAMTQTINAYTGMPDRAEDLPKLAGKLDDIRRANVEHHIALMREAKSQGAAVVGFGELFTGPYFALATDPMWFGLAEDAAEGPTVRELQAATKAEGMIVIAPIYELDPSGRRFNTAVVIEAGEILGKYRKSHIPYGANEMGSFNENFYYERSDGNNGRGPANVSKNDYFPVFSTSIARIGVAICYDRHFDGVMRSLAIEGAELVFSPAVTFGSKSRRMWDHEFATDAARHDVFIGGSNRKGAERPWNQSYYGESHFVGPSGPLANVSTHPELVIAEIDLEELAQPDIAGWDLRRDRRLDIFSRT